nr:MULTISPECIES: hypothetical protein [Burkholderia]
MSYLISTSTEHNCSGAIPPIRHSLSDRIRTCTTDPIEGRFSESRRNIRRACHLSWQGARRISGQPIFEPKDTFHRQFEVPKMQQHHKTSSAQPLTPKQAGRNLHTQTLTNLTENPSNHNTKSNA